MALNLPETAEEVVARDRTDVRRSLANSDPFLKNSWLGAIIVGFANRVFDFYFALRQSILEAFPDTAVDELEHWGSVFGVTRTPATVSAGDVTFGGTAGNTIPIDSILSTSASVDFETDAAGTLTLQSIAVASITRSGTVATVTTTAVHKLASNIPVTITDAVETEYNVVAAAIIVTGTKTFTFVVAGSPSQPATGTILAGFTSVSIAITSDGFGLDQNQLADTVISLQSPISGVNDDANVGAGALGGGSDQETDVALRIRVLKRVQDPVAHFNVAEIKTVALAIAGVTRVFVEEVTPLVGQVTIYFMRDNDVDPIPDPGEVTTVKAAIIAIKPASTSDDDVIVTAPVPVSSDFVFTDLQPNTETMQSAVTASLEQFFSERVVVGKNIDRDAYRAAIFNTVDPVTGEIITTFTLPTPAADITIVSGEIGTLGDITYP